jgi:enoyl-CoA hydratase
MADSSQEIITTLHSNGVLEIVIDRPPVNAFSIGLLDELAAALDGASTEARAILLRSEGRGFCAGGDVKEAEALPDFGGILGQARGSLRVSLALLHCAAPVVCAVHSYCVGVGVLAAGCADVLLASEGTRFVLAEIDNGATAGGVMALRLMPDKRLRAAMMTADPVLAEELHGYGSVHSVAPSDALLDSARRLAAKIAGKSPEAMRRLKRSLNNTTLVAEVEAAYRAELSYTYELNMLGHASQGRSAFITGERKSYLS